MCVKYTYTVTLVFWQNTFAKRIHSLTSGTIMLEPCEYTLHLAHKEATNKVSVMFTYYSVLTLLLKKKGWTLSYASTPAHKITREFNTNLSNNDMYDFYFLGEI